MSEWENEEFWTILISNYNDTANGTRDPTQSDGSKIWNSVIMSTVRLQSIRSVWLICLLFIVIFYHVLPFIVWFAKLYIFYEKHSRYGWRVEAVHISFYELEVDEHRAEDVFVWVMGISVYKWSIWWVSQYLSNISWSNMFISVIITAGVSAIWQASLLVSCSTSVQWKEGKPSE